ncbi:MAG: tetratricopeptide repeat protein [Planctomycetes bacterium]|nr:tetratricopeptide repeat protein [Planctomycetota bacterium]
MFKTHRYPLALFCAVCLTLLFISPTLAHRKDPSIHPDIVKCEDFLRNRDYSKAIDSLTALLNRDISGKDYAIYLIAASYYNLKEYDKAIATCNRLQADFPNSDWALKSAFKKADALMAQKNLPEAEKLYSEMLAKITDPLRRRKFAMEYVLAAREYLYPKDSEQKPSYDNYVVAKDLLSKAVELDCLKDEEEQARYEIIMCLSKMIPGQSTHGNNANQNRNIAQPPALSPAELNDSIDKFLEKFPLSARTDEILYFKANCQIYSGRSWDARETASQIDTKFPKSKFAPQALFETALAIKFSLKQDNHVKAVIDILKTIVSKYASSEYAPKAQMELAGFLNELQRFDDASAEYARYAELFPKDEKSPDALLCAINIFVSRFQNDKAVDLCNKIIKSYADSPVLQIARQKIAQISFARANASFLKKDYGKAIQMLNGFITEFPSAGDVPRAEYLKGECLKELQNYNDAIEQWKKTSAKFPAAAEAAKSLFMIADIYVEKLDDYENALKYYGKVTSGEFQATAAQKILTIKSRELYAETEKIFTTSEMPKAMLTLRNIDKLKLKAYQIDINDFFEKKLSFAGLNSIEMSIISADKEWEYAVPDYKKFKQFKIEIEMPYKAPGAYILACQYENLQAKTIVVVSDMAFVAKLSKLGVQLLGENMKKAEPVELENFRLATNGRILKAPKTMPDGITPHTAAVIADSDGNTAFNETDVSSLPKPAKTSDAAIITTDKAYYAPEEPCFFHIIIRKAQANALSIPEIKDFILKTAIANAETNSSVESEQTITLNEYGTYAGSLSTPGFMDSGTVTLRLYEKTNLIKPLATKSVNVISGSIFDDNAEYAQNLTGSSYGNISVLFAPDRDKYFTGDPIWVKAFIMDKFGRPYTERKVQYVDPVTGKNNDAMTAKDGGIDIKLQNTESLRGSGTLTINVMNYGSNEEFHSSYDVQILPRTFTIQLDKDLPDINSAIAGDQKSVKFFVKYSDDTPSAQKLHWSVKRTDESGEPALIAENNLTSSDKDGSGSFSFTPKDEGIYAIAIEGKGVYEEPVRFTFDISAASEKSEQKLWIFTNKNTYNINEDIDLKLYSLIEGKPLCFVTLEKQNVERTEKIYLTKGWNTLKLPLKGINESMLFINASAMQNNKFYSAEKPVQIKRELEISVDNLKDIYLPGEEVTLKLSVKDSSGTPATADCYAIVSETTVNLPNFNTYDAAKYIVSLPSNVLSFAGQTEEISQQLLNAMLTLNAMQNSDALVMMPVDIENSFKDNEKQEDYDNIGLGGGSGGRFGGRQMTGRGGGGRKQGRARPPLFNTLLAQGLKTDASGNAILKFKMPAYNSQIYVHFFANTADLMYGKLSKTFKAYDEINFTVIEPEMIYAGDTSSASVIVRNLASAQKNAEFEIKTIIDGKESILKNKLALQPLSGAEIYIDLKPEKPQDITLVLTYKGISRSFNISVSSARDSAIVIKSGFAVESQTIAILPPKEGNPQNGRISISAALSPESMLAGIADMELPNGIHDALSCETDFVIARVFSKIALLDYLMSSKKSDEKAAVALRSGIKSLLDELELLRNYHSAWTKDASKCAFSNSTENAIMSSLAYTAFASASKLGIEVEETLMEELSGQISSYYNLESNDEAKAFILYALSVNDKANFGYINRLYRDKDKLSARSLALLGLMLKSAGKTDMTSEIAKDLLSKTKNSGEAVYFDIPAEKRVGYADSNTAVTAITLEALATIQGDSQTVKGNALYIQSRRSSALWGNPIDSAFAAIALSSYCSAAKLTAGEGKLTVKINDAAPYEINTAEYSTKEFPAQGDQKVQLTFDGKGIVFYAITANYDTDSAKLPDSGISASVTMHYPKYLSEGMEVNENFKTKKLEAQVMSIGAAGKTWGMHIETEINTPSSGTYLLEQELPAGLLPDGIETSGGKFYTVLNKTEEGKEKFSIDTPVYSLNAGNFTVKPPKVYVLNVEPERVFTGAKTAIRVLQSGNDFYQAYKVNYGQHYEIGKYYFGKKDYKNAYEHLKPLLDDEMFSEQAYCSSAAKMLLLSSIKEGLGDSIIESFEILKEKSPDEILTFEDMGAVAKAYKEINEYERAVNVTSAILEAYFLQESNIAGTLKGIENHKKAVDVMCRLILNYQDCKLVRDMHSGLAQNLIAYAKSAGVFSSPDKAEKQFTRMEALEESARLFELYLSIYPEAKNCDEVSYSLANTYAEMPDYEKSGEFARLCSARYPSSKYLDGFDYISALSLYGNRKFEDAVKACEKIVNYSYSEEMVKDKTALNDTINLLTAQIYHAMGQIDKALEKYKLVKDKYADAGLTVRFLEGQAFTLPEITESPLKDTPEMEIEYSGVSEVNIKAYKIDLLMLFMKYKNIDSMESIEISGIKPILAKTATLANPNSHKKENQKIALDLKEKGAYYVTAKAGDFFSSGIFLRTNIGMTAQEDPDSGMMRVNVYNLETGKVEDNVNVTFISPEMADYKMTKTDPRGIAEMRDLNGLVTTIAEKDSSYALKKSQGFIREVFDQKQQIEMKPMQYDEEIEELEYNKKQYGENLMNQQKGVETKRTKK